MAVNPAVYLFGAPGGVHLFARDRPFVNKLAVGAENHKEIRGTVGDVDLVCHDEKCSALLGHLSGAPILLPVEQALTSCPSSVQVEIAKRLVGEDNLWIMH